VKGGRKTGEDRVTLQVTLMNEQLQPEKKGGPIWHVTIKGLGLKP